MDQRLAAKLSQHKGNVFIWLREEYLINHSELGFFLKSILNQELWH